MTLSEFEASLGDPIPPGSLSPALLALWRDGKGEWDRAHKCVDTLSDRDSMWVHAYLHRKEGDGSNARFWYSRAGCAPANIPIEQEWALIAADLLAVARGGK
jgi:hypothetical protein